MPSASQMGRQEPRGTHHGWQEGSAESKQADARERDLPLLQDADWFLGSSWYIDITGREQMDWKLSCVGRGHGYDTFTPHSVARQSIKSCPLLC